jgi:hypothetical protein
VSADPAASLHLELLRRNARLRAFRALGVPIVGGWRYVGRMSLRDDPFGREWAQWWARCGACASGERDILLSDPEALEIYEEEQGVPRCPHLAPLLQPDPPELAALLDLEILAGA